MKLLAVCGFSGGHIFPALGFLEAFMAQPGRNEALVILPRHHSAGTISSDAARLFFVDFPRMRFNLTRKFLSDCFYVIKAGIRSALAVCRFRPEVVVGFGSIVSIPVVLSAWLLRIKTVIHEQNVIPGRANKLLAPFVDSIAVSFDESRKYFRRFSGKLIVSGNPLRPGLRKRDKESALDYFGFTSEKLTLLVTGGSQGSFSINRLFLDALSRFDNLSDIQVIHISGAKELQDVSDFYKHKEITAKVYGFLREMDFAYSASDLVVSRAGATTISEIIFFALPALLIPYPYAAKHQSANASVLGRTGGACVVEEDMLTEEALYQRLLEMVRQRGFLEQMRRAYAAIEQPNARARLLQAVAENLRC